MNPPDKEKRRALKNLFKEKERKEYEAYEAERMQSMEALVDRIKLEEMNISSNETLVALTTKLEIMRTSGEIRLVKGSFNLNSVVSAEFIEKASGTRWFLECLNESPMGGGRLSRKA